MLDTVGQTRALAWLSIIKGVMAATVKPRGSELAARTQAAERILLCGGTALQRAASRAKSRRAFPSRPVIEAEDVQSLLRWVPRSSSVIVCGALAGLSAETLVHLIRHRAPEVHVARACPARRN